MECKSRKSRNTWSNRQVRPWSRKLSRVKANRVFPREHTGHSKTLFQSTRDDCTWKHHQKINPESRLIIFLAAKDGGALYRQQKQDLELTVAQTISYWKIQSQSKENKESKEN